MKKILFFSIALLTLLSSCESKKLKEELAAQQALQEATHEELVEAVANRDSLLSIVNQISVGMEQIKNLENILSTPGAESADARTRILSDMASIQESMQKNREKLQDLEAKLKKSNLANTELRRTIETLRAQIESQSEEINSLRASLDDANAQIYQLHGRVDSLNLTVDSLSSQVEQGEELANELNKCYYVAASSKELKAHKILESGFLKKTKLMKGDFDNSFFTVGDKRTLTQINLYSKKAKVLTNQPASSYEIVNGANGQKVLRITNPTLFWSVSNYLVVEID